MRRIIVLITSRRTSIHLNFVSTIIHLDVVSTIIRLDVVSTIIRLDIVFITLLKPTAVGSYAALQNYEGLA